MDEPLDVPRLLELRKLTRVISERIEREIKGYIATLAPLFSPHQIFGDHIRGGPKTQIKGAEKAFRELKSGFESLASSPPYSIPSDLEHPLEIFSATPRLTQVIYPYNATSGAKSAQVKITSPLKWVLSYPETTPSHILELLAEDRNRARDELRHCLLHCLALDIIFNNRPGLIGILEGLRLNVESTHLEGLGTLPVILLSCPISTLLPSDDIIIQNTEISGIPSFEEIINTDDIKRMSDPFRDQILALIGGESPEILREINN